MQSPFCAAGISMKNYSKSEEFRCVWEKKPKLYLSEKKHSEEAQFTKVGIVSDS